MEGKTRRRDFLSLGSRALRCVALRCLSLCTVDVATSIQRLTGPFSDANDVKQLIAEREKVRVCSSNFSGLGKVTTESESSPGGNTKGDCRLGDSNKVTQVMPE